MAIFVINEWLWADSSGENNEKRQREAFLVLVSLASSEHQIVVIAESRFEDKAWKLCKSAVPLVVNIAKVYFGSIRIDTNRCLVVKPAAVVPLTRHLQDAVKDDDHYLVHALLTVDGAILVTTDQPLRSVLTAVGLTCISREEFLEMYIKDVG